MVSSPGNRSIAALRCAWPAMLLATLVLLPFLNTPFTIDDPIFLQEADHVLSDPLHPQATELVWTFDVLERASNLLPGGIAAPYFLVPTVLAGNAEWVAHLTQILLLAVALFGTALVALRLGLDHTGATVAALLAGTAPAVLGMAGTAMPDIPTMALSVLGMERILAWRQQRRWHQAVLAAFWLALAALTRAHTVLLLAAATVFLLDGITLPTIRSSLRSLRNRIEPVAAVPVLMALAFWITADPDAATDPYHAQQTWRQLTPIATNVVAFLMHWWLTAPLTAMWLWLRWRRVPWMAFPLAILAAIPFGLRLGWAPFLAAGTAVVLFDIFHDAISRKDRDQLALALWLMPALALAIYAHLPGKYIVPLLPAAGILVARLLPEAQPAARRWLPVAATAVGLAVSLLVLNGIRDLARTQRRAAMELVASRVFAGQHVWFAGHWGFHWYAEAAGARAAVLQGDVPKPGDVVVLSLIDHPAFAKQWKRKQVLQRVSYNRTGGHVMENHLGAGFFTSMFGFLPWSWGPGQANVFEVWKIE